jgi:dUTPase
MRIAQLVIASTLRASLVETAQLPRTGRGAGGFGSTGFADAGADRRRDSGR